MITHWTDKELSPVEINTLVFSLDTEIAFRPDYLYE